MSAAAEATLARARELIEAHFAPLGPSKADTIAALNKMLGEPADVCAEMRALCSACGGTGDVHGLDGEWRGECKCAVAQADRITALEAKCTLLSASLKQADEVRDRLVEALKDAHPYVDHAGVRIAIGAALASAGAA